MIVEEGPNANGDIPRSDRIVWMIILSTSSSAKTGATAQAPSAAGGAIRAESDQSVGKIGPVVGEYAPERFARMTAEF